MHSISELLVAPESAALAYRLPAYQPYISDYMTKSLRFYSND